MRRVLVLWAAAVVLAATLVPVAWASTQTAVPVATTADAHVVQGAGSLLAVGRGTVQVDGSGVVTGRIAIGTLVVRDAERVTVQGYGRKEVLPDGSVRYSGVRGEFKITGSDFDIDLRGAEVRVRATGHGVVRLSGVGRYWVNGGLMGGWPGSSNPIEIG